MSNGFRYSCDVAPTHVSCTGEELACVKGAIRLSLPAWWGALPGPTLLWGAGPVQGGLVKRPIIKSLATHNADDSKVLVSLLAQSLIRHHRAINALDAEGVSLGRHAFNVLQRQASRNMQHTTLCWI